MLTEKSMPVVNKKLINEANHSTATAYEESWLRQVLSTFFLSGSA